MENGRKGFGQGATCGVAGHGAWRGDTRKSSTKKAVQCGLVEGARTPFWNSRPRTAQPVFVKMLSSSSLERLGGVTGR